MYSIQGIYGKDTLFFEEKSAFFILLFFGENPAIAV